jgi:guanylate kinase
MRRKAFPIVLAAPSGAGKTSLAQALVERRADTVFSLSATTRPPRPGERHGVDYEFVDDAGFESLVQTGELLEWAEVHGRRYGTLRRGVADALAEGRIVLLDIDVQGARHLRSTLPDAVLVFVLPPTTAEMLRRLQGRKSESPAELAIRMRTALAEIEQVKEFDYVVVNDDFEETMRTLEAILLAESHRIGRAAELDDVLAAFRADIDVTLKGSSE